MQASALAMTAEGVVKSMARSIGGKELGREGGGIGVFSRTTRGAHIDDRARERDFGDQRSRFATTED
jgi:hypothetical protein